MLYRLLKFPAQLALLIWCRYYRVNKPEWRNSKGPLLIAANHPNSFLDAILLCSLFKRPVYSLARGDAFSKPFFNKLLRSMNMLPVYRLSEGAENLEHNYKTFGDCIKIFKQNGIVLIFSEGKCINEWNLRSLKKGTARLAVDAWQQDIPLQVIPLGINYSSFTQFGKNVQLNFGEVITKEQFESNTNTGSKILSFNAALKAQLEKLVVQIKPVIMHSVQQQFAIPVSSFKKVILFLPAMLGFILHQPFYYPIRKFAFRKFGKIDHYDSVVVGLCFIFYPLYLGWMAGIIAFLTCGYWWFLVFTMPFLACAYVQIKKQI